MKIWAPSIAVLFWSACALTPSAVAQDLRDCTDPRESSASERVAACTDLINAGYGRAGIYLARANAYLKLRDDDRAIGDYTRAIMIDQYLREAFSGRGYARARKHDYKRAVGDYSNALSLGPGAKEFHWRGQAYYQMGEFKRALEDYNRALNIDPDSAEILNSRCWARAILHVELELALGDCDRSIGLRESPNTRDSRAMVYFQLARYADAIDEYDFVLNGKPNSAGALYMRGVARNRLGAVEMGGGAESGDIPASMGAPDARDAHGGTRRRLGDQDIGAALQIDPDIAETYAQFGIAP